MKNRSETRELRIERRDIDKLNPAPYNPRIIDDKALSGLRVSMEKFGCVEPIVWNERTGNIVGGHQRYKILKKMGLKMVDVVVVNLSEMDEKALNVSLNNQNIQGTFDMTELEKILDEIKPELSEFSALGLDDFKFGEISQINPMDEKGIVNEQEAEEDNFDENDVDNLPEIAKPGDIWLCGSHRVMCGDSTKKEDVEKLLDGRIPVLMVTDPPYGVKYDPGWREGKDLGVGKKSKGKVINDDVSDWSSVFVLWDIDVIYAWHSGIHATEVDLSLRKNGYEIIAQIIWAKQHFVFSRGDYHWQHESCWYVVKKGKRHNYQGARDQSTLWQIKNNNTFGNGTVEEKFGHGTQKPIECMARPIRNNSAEGEWVCDPFLGSGTTMIAAEQLNRICFGMEIFPKYVDMSIRRWEKMTSKKALHIDTGKEFGE